MLSWSSVKRPSEIACTFVFSSMLSFPKPGISRRITKQEIEVKEYAKFDRWVNVASAQNLTKDFHELKFKIFANCGATVSILYLYN